MLRYWILRLQSSLMVFVPALLLTIMLDLSYGVPSFIYCIAGILFALLGHRTNWILILPPSRKKLFAWHLLEAGGTALISFCIAALPLVLSKPIKNWEFVLGVPIFVVLIKYFTVFRQSFLPQQNTEFKVSNKKRLLLILAAAVIYLSVHYRVNLLVVLFLCAIYTAGFIFPAFMLQPPLVLHKKLVKSVYGVVGGMSFLVIFGSLYCLYFAKPTYLTELSYSLWNGLNVKVGEARGLEILKWNNVGGSGLSRDLIKRFGDKIDIPEIVDRAKHCQSHTCVRFVTDLAANRPDEAKFDALKALILEGSHGKTKAKNPKYDFCEYLTGWEKPFADSSVSIQWLKDGDPIQQTFAIKILSGIGANPEQLKEIEKLTVSKVPEVSNAAKIHLAVYQNLAMANKAHCEKDPEGKACRHFNVAPALENAN